MAYTVSLYYNTGFDSVNIPDSPALLEQVDKLDFDALNILQNQELGSIRIKATFEQVKNADYCRIGEMYYYINSVTMLNANTCELSLHCDYISSLGGVSMISIDSGWLTRAHVDDDALFKWTIPEDFVPNESLQINQSSDLIDYSGSTDKILIQSTVNLPSLKDVDTELKALTFTSGTTEDAMYIPYCPPVLYETTVGMVWGDPASGTGIKSTTTPKSVLFLGENEANIKGLSVLRSISAESSILAQYVIPSVFINSSYSTVSDFGSYTSLISNKFSHNITSLPFVYDSEIKNKKCFCGEYNKYILFSNVSGNKTESLPEDICGGGLGYPLISSSSDLRPNGSPFAWFTYNRGILDYDLQNAVYGLPWQDAPLVYTSKSGSNLDRYNFLSSMYKQNVNFNSYLAGAGVGALGSALSSATSTNFSTQQGGYNFLGSARESIGNGGFGYVNQGLNLGLNSFNYEMDRSKQTQQFLFNQAYQAPEIQFPRQEGLRDFIGNNFKVYRLRLSYNDLRRFDKYLTAFGYKLNEIFDKKYFTTRQKFNYIEASSVQLSTVNASPLRLRIGAENQLTGGVRVWHVIPNLEAFNENPIK